jgi:adenosylmethionine-8-amino-7-oxononanoate aminotransferase
MAELRNISHIYYMKKGGVKNETDIKVGRNYSKEAKETSEPQTEILSTKLICNQEGRCDLWDYLFGMN